MTVEKECLAVKWGIQNFGVYVMGKPFRIDGSLCPTMVKQFQREEQPARWSLALQLIHFSFEHKKGKDNANADTLSRMPEYMFKPLKGGGKMTEPWSR